MKNVVSTAIGTKRQPLGGSQGQQHGLYCLGRFLGKLDQKLENGFLMTGTVVSVKQFMTPEGRILSTQVA